MNKTGIILITIFVIIIVIAIIFVTIYFKNKSLLKIKGGEFTRNFGNEKFDGAIFSLLHINYIKEFNGKQNILSINKVNDDIFVKLLDANYLSDSYKFNTCFYNDAVFMISKCEYPSNMLLNFTSSKNIINLINGFYNIESKSNNPAYIYIINEKDAYENFYFKNNYYNININDIIREDDIIIHNEEMNNYIATITSDINKNYFNNIISEESIFDRFNSFMIVNNIKKMGLQNPYVDNLKQYIEYCLTVYNEDNERIRQKFIDFIIQNIEEIQRYTFDGITDLFISDYINETFVAFVLNQINKQYAYKKIINQQLRIKDIYQYINNKISEYEEHIKLYIYDLNKSLKNIKVDEITKYVFILLEIFSFYTDMPGFNGIDNFLENLFNNMKKFIISDISKYLINLNNEFNFTLPEFEGLNEIDEDTNIIMQDQEIQTLQLYTYIKFVHIDISYEQIFDFENMYNNSYKKIQEYLYSCMNNTNKYYFVRMIFDKYGNYLSEYDNYTNCGTEQQYTINIPGTTKSFGMDIFSMFLLNNNLYIVQIEFSENDKNHKSNMLEFIGLVGRFYGWNKNELKSEIKNMGYSKLSGLKEMKNINNFDSPILLSNDYMLQALNEIIAGI